MKEILPGVFYCGLHDKDRKVFDQLVPLPQGTTYNSYMVRGSQKCALIDTMYVKFRSEYLDMISSTGIAPDYIISNHAEPDHTGVIPALLKQYPKTLVYCSAKCAENLKNMLHVPADRLKIVSDGEELDLGGRTLRFISAPWVHWPDTMFTHLVEDNLLFTCDYFGAHYTHAAVMADYTPELAEAAKRYYAEIMMPFRSFCAKYLEKVRALNPKMILPSHGPVYDKPEFIMNLYADWTSTEVARKVIIAYVSMYDNSKIMAEYLQNALSARGMEVVCADIMTLDEGEMAMELIDAAGLVFGTSMVLTGPHPKSVYLAYLINLLRPKLKFYSVIGSFGWGGNLTAPIDAMFSTLKLKKFEPVIAKGKPLPADFAKLDALAEAISATA